MKRLALLFLIAATPVFAQYIDPQGPPKGQLNWPRVSGNGSPASAGFTCSTSNFGQPYTDKSGPHYWVCSNAGGTPTWYQVDGNAGSSTVIQVNSTPTTPVSPVNLNDNIPAPDDGYINAKVRQDGNANVSFEVPSTVTPGVQINPNPPDSNQGIFLPFTVCTKVPSNVGLLIAQTCTGDAGYQATGMGGIFNHLAQPSIIFSNPVLPAGLNPANITAVYAMYWGGFGGTMSATVSCAATGVGASVIPWSSPNFTQSMGQLVGIAGANVPTVACTMNQSQSVFGDYGNSQMAQSGVWVEYTGTPVTQLPKLGVQWPINYSADGNLLFLSQYWPDNLSPRLFSKLPNPDKNLYNQAGYPTYVVSDNSTGTVGSACVGTGTPAGPPYSLCTANGGGGWTYVGTFGGSGPPAVSSVSNTDGSLTLTPTVGDVVGSINTAHTNTWSAGQEFDNRVVLGGAHAPLNFNGDDGLLNYCALGGGAGNTPHWGPCPGGGTIGGSGTAGYFACWTAGTTLANCLADYGVTLGSYITFSAPVQIVDTSHPSQMNLIYNAGHAPSCSGSTTACLAVDSSGNLEGANAGGAFFPLGANGLSGMTAGQVPIAATATTVTSSKAIQGTDTNLLSSGTISGTGAALCTDANGGATTSGCSPATTVNVNGSSVSNPNFNGSSPSPDASFIASTYKVTGSNVITETPYASSSAFGVIKPDGSSCTVTAGVLTCPGGTGATSIPICSDSSGSGTAQSCTTSPSFTPTAGSVIAYTTTTSNTGTGLTINVNSLGAKSVAKWQTTTTLAASDIRSGVYILMTYNGTNWAADSIGNAPVGNVKLLDTPLDAVPGSPSAMDDEFTNETVLDPKWTVVSDAGGSIGSHGFLNSQSFYEQFVGSGGTAFNYYEQNAPSTPWTITVKFYNPTMQALSGNFSQPGLVIQDTGTKAVVYWIYQYGLNGYQVCASTTAPTAFCTTNVSSAAFSGAPPNQWVYFRIANDGTTLTFSYSFDGVVFGVVATDPVGSHLGTISKVGIIHSINSGGGLGKFYWFRKTP